MKIKRSGIRLLRAFTVLTCVAGMSACAPAGLFGNPESDIKNLPSYRRVNPACSEMNLSNSRLDVPTARKLVNCLNGSETGQGALGELAVLVRAMSDDELKPFVEGINRSFLRDAKNLYEASRLLEDLRARGELDSALAGLGTLLEQDELIARSISMFRRSYVSAEGHVDPRFLRVLARLSRELTNDHVADALDLGLLASGARSFASLWDKINGLAAIAPLDPAVAEGIVAYARSDSGLGRELIGYALDGSLFELTDKIVPDDSLGLEAQVPRLSAILDPLTADQGQIAAGVGALFETVSGPIPCLHNARSLRYTPMDVLGELVALPSTQARAFISRDKLAQLYSVYPLCDFPAAAATGYGALVRLANTPAIEPLTDVLREAYRIQSRDDRRPIADFIVRALASHDFRHLLPALGQLHSRDTWQDLLLLATAPRLRDRSQLTELLRVLIEPLPGPEGTTTIYDVLNEGIANSDPAELHAWLQSFKSTDKGMASAFLGMCAAFHVNDGHALLSLVRGVMSDAPKDSELIEALLKISARPQFQGSLRELSRMSSDGRLKEILSTVLSLFKKFAATGQSEIHALPPGAAAPSLRFTVRHSLASGDLAPYLGTIGAPEFGVCTQIDLSVRWDQPQAPDFDKQYEAVSSCIGVDHHYSAFADSLKLLAREKTDSDSSRSVYSVLIDAYGAFKFTQKETALLADGLLDAIKDGRVVRTLQALPILVKQSVLRPLVDLVAPWISDAQARLGMRRLGLYGASVLKRVDLPRTVAYVDDLFRAHPAAPAPQARALYDRERLLRWISNKECVASPTEQSRQARLEEIIDEYENAIVPDGVRSAGKLRREWSLPELKTELSPVFSKFADIPDNGPLLRGLLSFTARFNDRKQYKEGYLEKWLRDRADDRRIISYFYPGEDAPRVRIVNGLDRLGLILLNADIYAGPPIEMNFGMQFLANIAEAWGDVPFEDRPAEIQAKFPKGKKCPTLAEAVTDIFETAQTFYGLVGFPKLPACNQIADPRDPPELQKAETTDPTVALEPGQDPPPEAEPGSELAALKISMFNIAQTVSVLQENVADGGMRVLRDLFYELYYKGPVEHQDPSAGLKNNLSVVTSLVRAGLLREVGRLIADTPSNDPVIHSFFSILIEAAASPETGPMAEALFADSKLELIWNVIDEVLKLKSPRDIANAKLIGLHGLAALDSDKPNELLEPALRALTAVLTHDPKLLARHADLVTDLITWTDGADFLRALNADHGADRRALTSLVSDAVSDPQRGRDLLTMLGALDSSPASHAAWNDFRARFDTLDGLPEYRALKLNEMGRQLLNFFEGRTDSGHPLSADKAALSRKILLTVGVLLERGDFELVDQLMALAQRQPDAFYKLIEATSALVEGGEIPRLLELVQSKLGPN
jgi:hypothetical protein